MEKSLGMKILDFRVPHFCINIRHFGMYPRSKSMGINTSFTLFTNSFILFLVTLYLTIKAVRIIVENGKYREVYREK